MAATTTSPFPRGVPWHAVVRSHREHMRHDGEGFFALPVTSSGAGRWSSLAGFEPGQLAGPWEIDLEALESAHLQRAARAGLGEAFIGGPCWFRWQSEGGQRRHLEWVPLIYREVAVEVRDERLHIIPVQEGWDVCPLVFHFLEERNVQTLAPLDEVLPDLLSRAENKAGAGGPGLSRALADAFALVAPELGEALAQARDDFPADQVEHVPSPWVLFSTSASSSAMTQHILSEYGRLERNLAVSPKDVGGLGLLDHSPGLAVQLAPEFVPVVPLNDTQRFAVECTLAGSPVTVINGPPGSGKSEVVLSILLNAWASSTTVLFASGDEQLVEDLRGRLKSFESDFEIAVHADEQHFDEVDEALGRTIELVTVRQGESHYGSPLSGRKRAQLMQRKQELHALLESRMPERLEQAIESAIESHAAQREARSTLEARREELIETLRAMDPEADADFFAEQVVVPLRQWREGMNAVRRLVDGDAQRLEALQRELDTARSERDAALAACEIEDRSDESLSWLVAEPGLRSFEQALAALSRELEQPIEDPRADGTWDKAYDAWRSSQSAAEWERRARETASLVRSAGMGLAEKLEELRVAREALDSAKRAVQEATKASSIDVRREDVDEWAACYAELCAMPRGKLSFLHRSRSAELVEKLERLERRFRTDLPVHIWGSIRTLDETGRARLSRVIERAREWLRARESWESLGTVREEIDADADAIRRRLTALGARAQSIEVTPATCGPIAAKLAAKADVAAAAAAAWARRERRERLPGELVALATGIREAASGSPVKERWMKGAGAPLMAALDSVASDPSDATMAAVRREARGAASSDPMLKSWRKAYEAETERLAVAEEMERIPARDARLANWKARRPTFLPARLDIADAFDGDESHPVWAYLADCEAWGRSWTAFHDEEAPGLEQTANENGTAAMRHLGDVANLLPQGVQTAWLDAFMRGPALSGSWPEDEIRELSAPWREERLRAEIEEIDTRLERITFENAREQWLDRVARDIQVVRTLNALRDHYRHHRKHIEASGYAHFEQALKAQPVWITSATSAQSIPMRPGLFDLLVIDDATHCTLANMLPLIFRAKRLVVIGDTTQAASAEDSGVGKESDLGARSSLDEWTELLEDSHSNVYEAVVGMLPRGQADVISIGDIPQ